MAATGFIVQNKSAMFLGNMALLYKYQLMYYCASTSGLV
jgi:hypothetical protein